MMKRNELFKSAKALYSYEDYKHLLIQLYEQGKSTGETQSKARYEATAINLQRIRRLDKTLVIRDEIRSLLKGLNRRWNWYLISEGWCGDSAQNLPYIARIAQLHDNITLKILLRDDNPFIMDQYLTNGGKAVPKLICLDADSDEEQGTWGPRSSGIAEKVKAYKAEFPDASHDEFVLNIHGWYAKDKGLSLQQDFTSLIRDWIAISN